jgi:outer membrane protein assembly factor BamB
LADGWLYIGSADGNVYALDAKTGEIHWRFKTKDLVRATPTVDKGTVYIGSWDGDVYALDAQTGELRWQSSIASDTMPYYLYRPVQSKALIADGLVFDASRKASVVALDEKTGEIKWEYSYGMALWVESSPRLVGDTIYIGSSGSQNLYLLDKQTGKLLGGLNTGTFNWGTPLILNDTLYIGGAVYKDPRERGGLLAYEIKDNSKLMEKWRVPVATTLDPGAVWSGVASSPIEANGVIYFGALDGKIYVVAP